MNGSSGRALLTQGTLLLSLACGPAGTVSGELSAAKEAQGVSQKEIPAVENEPEDERFCVPPSLEALRTELFVPSCATAQCHAGETPAEGLDLSLEPVQLAARLLQPARQSPSGMPLVTPGSIGASYLLLKVALADPLRGAQMPKGEAPIEGCAQEALRTWIIRGAP